MKYLKKVIIGILIVVAVLIIGGVVVNRIADSKLRAALADVPGARLDFKKLNVSLFSGNLELRDVEVELRDSTGASTEVEGRIKAIRLERVSWSRLLRGEAHARRLLIREPDVRMVLPGKSKKEEVKKDTAGTTPEASFLKKVSLSEVRMEKGGFGLKSRKDSTSVSAQGIAFSVRDIAVELPEGRIEYNDSLYRVALDSLDYRDAGALSRIQIGHLATADAGAVEAQALRFYNCVPQEELAIKMGKVSVMWYDAKLDSLYTSPVNIPRMVKDQRINIDQVSLSGPEVVMLQDDRYAPPAPYPTFQESLNTVTMPLMIGHIDARIKKFTFIWEITHENRGTFPLHNLRIAVNSASNASKNVMKLGIKSGQKDTGHLDFSLTVHNDKQETTSGYMKIHDLEGSHLDSFLRPLFGATIKADIHQIDCSFKGNKDKMTDDFCMLYDNLSLKAWDDASAPYKFVASSSKTISFLANLAVPKSNPVTQGKDPKKVEVGIERNPMLPYPSYIIQNLTMGMLHTVLPGGSVHKKENLQKK